MRLINTHTLKLEEHFNNIPQYAVLSHTWGEGEVTFNDWKDLDAARKKPGFRKIDLTCQQAKKDGYKYAWVDTNCIDKSSSSELSEAINSMFAWYRDAQVCYVFLKDVVVGSAAAGLASTSEPATSSTPITVAAAATTAIPSTPNPVSVNTPSPSRVDTNGTGSSPRYRATKDPKEPQYLSIPAIHNAFKSSAWFTRGWTLQELLAPSEVIFFSYEWLRLATKDEARRLVSDITRIDSDYIKRPDHITSASVARRMSWMADRKTTRIEDTAYCLLGLFGIHMALLYGEGHRAFLRLQEEIIRVSNDQTIFCWQASAGHVSMSPQSLPSSSVSSTPSQAASSSTSAKTSTTAATGFSSTASATGTPHREYTNLYGIASMDVHRQAELEKWTSILAPHPSVFRDSALYFSDSYETTTTPGDSTTGSWGHESAPSSMSETIGPYSITNFGLSISLPLLYTAEGACAVLDVGYRRTSRERPSRIVIPLHRVQSGHYLRLSTNLLVMRVPPALTRKRTQLFVDCRNTPSRGAAQLLNRRVTTRRINLGGGNAESDMHPVIFLMFSRPVNLDRTPRMATGMDFVAFHSAIEANNHQLGCQGAVMVTGKVVSNTGAESFLLLVGGRSVRFEEDSDDDNDSYDNEKANGNEKGIPRKTSEQSSKPFTERAPTMKPPLTRYGVAVVAPAPIPMADQPPILTMDWHVDILSGRQPIGYPMCWQQELLRPMVTNLPTDYFGSWAASQSLSHVISWQYEPGGAIVCYFVLNDQHRSVEHHPVAENAGNAGDLIGYSHIRKGAMPKTSIQYIEDILKTQLMQLPPDERAMLMNNEETPATMDAIGKNNSNNEFAERTNAKITIPNPSRVGRFLHSNDK